MHPTMKPRDQWTREEIVGFHLTTLALRIDPEKGRWTELAAAIEVDPITLTRWKTNGYVPWYQVRRLRTRYGEELVPDELCPVEYRH